MRAVGNGESAIYGKLFREHHRSDFIEASAAVFLRNSAAQQANLACLLDQLRHQTGLFVLQVFYERQDFLDDKLLRGLADELLVVGEVGGCKNVMWKGSLEEKAAALGGWFADRCSGHRGLLCRY